MRAYYNELDPYAAQWLRNLITAGHIAPGDVDERSIAAVQPADLVGYTQCHFFAGIGVWSYALRLAGWPDDRPVWTGSCPCQPFSSAGKRRGLADERHLWPAWSRLIGERGPVTIFGEQVADGAELDWLDHVRPDLEARDYAVGVVVLPAASVGAPHGRHRLFFVADAHHRGSQIGRPSIPRANGCGQTADDGPQAQEHRQAGGLADPDRGGRQGPGLHLPERGPLPAVPDAAGGGSADGLGDAASLRRRGVEAAAPQAGSSRPRSELAGFVQIRPQGSGVADRLGHAGGDGLEGLHARGPAPRATLRGRADDPLRGFWADADWLYCTDGKWRPVEPGSFPLADRSAFRVGSDGPLAGKSRQGMLRAYGNAIVPWAAAAFIRAFMEATGAADR